MEAVGLSPEIAVAVPSHDRPEARLLVSRPRDPAAARRLADGGAELVDVDDRAALADAYRAAWGRRPVVAAACRARAEDFSNERCTDRYEALYRELR